LAVSVREVVELAYVGEKRKCRHFGSHIGSWKLHRCALPKSVEGDPSFVVVSLHGNGITGVGKHWIKKKLENRLGSAAILGQKA
jgi:hypothetical protein